MESIFADIESYAAEQYPKRRGAFGMPGRSAVATSMEDLDEAQSPQSAAISDEQVAELHRAQVVLSRLLDLDVLFFEDFGTSLQASSRSAFECFMKYNPMGTMPLIGAEPSGLIVATWTNGAECLSLRFTDRFHLDFAIVFNDAIGARVL